MQVVVVGSDYSGTLVANLIDRTVQDARITVINPRPDFVERVRLHQQIAGTYSAATPLAQVLWEATTLRVGAVALEEMGTHSAFSSARAGVSLF